MDSVLVIYGGLDGDEGEGGGKDDQLKWGSAKFKLDIGLEPDTVDSSIADLGDKSGAFGKTESGNGGRRWIDQGPGEWVQFSVSVLCQQATFRVEADLQQFSQLRGGRSAD